MQCIPRLCQPTIVYPACAGPAAQSTQAPMATRAASRDAGYLPRAGPDLVRAGRNPTAGARRERGWTALSMLRTSSSADIGPPAWIVTHLCVYTHLCTLCIHVQGGMTAYAG